MSTTQGQGLVLDDDEWDELFGDHVGSGDAPPRRRLRWQLIALFAGLTFALSSLAVVVNAIRSIDQLSDPADIIAEAQIAVSESPYGWLVSGLVVEPIEPDDVGGYVRSAPADGIIHIDDRNWEVNDLHELIAHEAGHLLAFAAFGTSGSAGGLETEVWAECATVTEAHRHLDSDGADHEYRCTADELAVYEDAVASLGEICRPWGEPLCRGA